MKMKKQDFKFDFDALQRMEDKGVYFGSLDTECYSDLTIFFWACSDGKYTQTEILSALLGGRLPLTVADLLEQLDNVTKKA